MQTLNGINLLGFTSTGTIAHEGLWNQMVFKEVNEVGETIEMIYTQILNVKYRCYKCDGKGCYKCK